MKWFKFVVLAAFLGYFLFLSCEKQKEEEPPALPPYESMAVDFSSFVNSQKAALGDQNQTTVNFDFAAGTVGFWNLLLTVHLAVPVASFYQSFSHQPVLIGDKTWQWSYNVTGFVATYTARLVGTVRENDVKWEMYISKAGVDPFDEFMWYEGTSDLDGMGGQWILYHSAEFQEKTLQIDWTKENEEIGGVKYTAIRELKDDRTEEPFYGSNLTYGLQEGDFNAFYNIHFYDIWTQQFVDCFIDWNSTQYNGRVKAEYHFKDTNWHCWDGSGYDTDCE